MSLNLVKDSAFALLPQCESYKNKEDRNTSFAPLYNGYGTTNKLTATMVNMASSYGYYWDGTEWVYRFDGNNDIINSNYNLTFESGMNLSFSFWIKFDTVGTAKGIAGFVNDPNNYVVIQQTVSNAIEIRYRLLGGTVRFVSTPSSAVSADVWYHVIITIGDTDCNIYIDNNAPSNGTIDYTGAPITSSGFGIGSYLFSGTYYSINGSIKNLILFENKELTIAEVDILYNAGADLEGLRGIPYTDGAMSFLEERIGLYDTHKNIVSLISSAIPRTSDFNTGLIPLVQGESAASTITGTLTNFGSGFGFIAESGGVPAHVLFDGDSSTISMGDIEELNNTSSFSIRMSIEFLSLVALNTTVFAKYKDATDHINVYYNSSQKFLFIIIKNSGSTNFAYLNNTTDIITTGVKYDLGFNYNGDGATEPDKIQLTINGVDQSLVFSGTTPSTTSDLSPAELMINASGGLLSAKLYDFILYSDAKSPDWIKDQYYSSQNEWQGDLSGTEPETPDGTMTLSAEYTYLDAQQCWLEYDNFTVVPHTWATGRKGRWKRQPGLGFVDEILARWSLSAYAGCTLDSVRLLSYCDTQGTQTGSATSTVYEQDKKIASNWANGVPGPPQFDDFDVSTAWATSLDTLSVQDGSQVYEYTDGSGNIRALAQAWIDTTKDEDDGLIIDADFQALGWYLDVFNVKLGIKMAGGLLPVLDRIYRRRRRI